MMKEKGKIVNILEVEEDDKERNRGAALLSIYNEFKDEIKAIRTDIQHLNIQQPQQSDIIRKSKFPQNPKRSVRFSGKRTKRSVQKRKARNTQKAETKVL